jgi:hypothetical protein
MTKPTYERSRNVIDYKLVAKNESETWQHELGFGYRFRPAGLSRSKSVSENLHFEWQVKSDGGAGRQHPRLASWTGSGPWVSLRTKLECHLE